MNEIVLSNPKIGTSKKGMPVWEMAYLYPFQGEWSEDSYLNLHTNRLIEFDNGFLEFLPMPTLAHQLMVLYLYRVFDVFVQERGLGRVLTAPLRVRLWAKKYREPDIIFLASKRLEKTKGDYPDGADLVMEVVSGGVDDRYRDLVEKREEYAQAGIAEYWIVDPEQKRITVLHLSGKKYGVHGEFGEGERATSPLLDGFEVEVTAVFAAAN